MSYFPTVGASKILDLYGRPLELPDPVFRADGWVNGLTGIGVRGVDKSQASYFENTWRIQDQELRSLNDGSDLAAKVVWDRPNEAFREGYDLTGKIPKPKKSGNPTDNATDVPENDLKDLRDYATEQFEVDSIVHESTGWGRLFGGCLNVMGVDDGGYPWEPVNEDRIRSFDFLSLVDRRYAYVQSQYAGMNAKKYGTAQIYLISNAIAGSGWNDHGDVRAKTPEELQNGGAQIQLVHSSRVIRFDGNPADVQSRQRLAGWSWSVLQRVYAAMRQFEHAFDSTAYLLSDASQGVFKMMGLMKAISAGNRQAIMDRAMAMEMSRSVVRGILLDAGDKNGAGAESYERQGTPLAGIADILKEMKSRFAAAANEPQTKLFGSSPAGLNATGESDMRLWYDDVRSEANVKIAPKLRRIFRYIALSKDSPLKGKKINFTVDFKPLWSPTDGEVATANLARAQTDAALITATVISSEVAALTWTDEYPALDADAIQEEIDAKTSFDPHENDPDPKPGEPGGPPLPPASGGGGGGGGEGNQPVPGSEDPAPNAGTGEPLSAAAPIPPIGPGPRLQKPPPGSTPSVATPPGKSGTPVPGQKGKPPAAPKPKPAGIAPPNRGPTITIHNHLPTPKASTKKDSADWRYDSDGWDLGDEVALARLDAMCVTRTDGGEAKAVFRQLLKCYPASCLGWVLAGHWYRQEVPLDRIDMSGRSRWTASKDGKVDKHVELIESGKSDPVILVSPPGEAQDVIVDGHHRTLAYEKLGKPVDAYLAEVHTDAASAPWRSLHAMQKRGSSIGSVSVAASIPADVDAMAAPRLDWKPREEAGRFAKAEHSEVVSTPHGEAHVQLRVMPSGEHVFSARARTLDGKVTKPQHVRIPADQATPERLEAEADGKRTMAHGYGLSSDVRAQGHALAHAMRERAMALRAASHDDAADRPIDQHAVICLVFDEQDRILTVSRPEPPHEQSIPGGMIDPGEGPDTTAWRELFEETGVSITDLRYVTQLVSPLDGRPVQVFVAGGYEGDAYAAEDGTKVEWLSLEDLVAQSQTYRPSLEALIDAKAFRRTAVPRAARPPNPDETTMGGIHVQRITDSKTPVAPATSLVSAVDAKGDADTKDAEFGEGSGGSEGSGPKAGSGVGFSAKATEGLPKKSFQSES